jgi:hypothetical protein
MQTEIAFYAVKDLIPGFLDVAGMSAEADRMRGVDVHDCESVDMAVTVIRQVKDAAPERWADVVEEVCFWAEALVWASWSLDATTLEECRRALGKAIAEGYHLVMEH